MPSRRALLTAVGAAVASTAGCLAAAPRSDRILDPLADTRLDERATTQFQGGLHNRGAVDHSIPSAVAVDWRLPINRGDHTAAKSTPVQLPDGDVVVAADTGHVRRISPAGDVRWTATVEPTTRGIHGTPAVANETVYVGAYDGALYAFDLETGTRRWRRPLGDAIGSSPVYYNGVVYVAVEYFQPSGSVAAVDAATGAQVWADDRPTNHPHSTIAIDLTAGRLVVGANDGNCYAWTFPGLERAWVFETGAPIKGPVATHGDLAIVGSWDHHVYGVDLDDGSRQWSAEMGAEVMSGPAIADGRAYVGSHDGTVAAFDAANGEREWQYATGGAVIGALTATPAHVLAGSYDRALHAIDASTGRRRWRTVGDGAATSAPLVTADGIYYAERRSADGPGFLYRLVEA